MPGDATLETGEKGQDDAQQGLKYPRIVPVGLNGFLVQFSGGLNEASNRAALAFKAAIDQQAWHGIEETSSTLASSFLRFDTAALTHSQMRAQLAELLGQHDWYQAALPQGRRLFVIPCADTDPAILRLLHRLLHHIWIPCVKAASNIGRGDHL